MTTLRSDEVIAGMRARLFIPVDWMVDAACRDADPGIFFIDHPGSGSAAEARAVCTRCPVRVECLDYALAANERHGIWGGLTERQRRATNRVPLPREVSPCLSLGLWTVLRYLRTF